MTAEIEYMPFLKGFFFILIGIIFCYIYIKSEGKTKFIIELFYRFQKPFFDERAERVVSKMFFWLGVGFIFIGAIFSIFFIINLFDLASLLPRPILNYIININLYFVKENLLFNLILFTWALILIIVWLLFRLKIIKPY